MRQPENYIVAVVDQTKYSFLGLKGESPADYQQLSSSKLREREYWLGSDDYPISLTKVQYRANESTNNLGRKCSTRRKFRVCQRRDKSTQENSGTWTNIERS